MDSDKCHEVKDTLKEILQRMDSLLKFNDGPSWINDELRALINEARGVIVQIEPDASIPFIPKSELSRLELYETAHNISVRSQSPVSEELYTTCISSPVPEQPEPEPESVEPESAQVLAEIFVPGISDKSGVLAVYQNVRPVHGRTSDVFQLHEPQADVSRRIPAACTPAPQHSELE